MREKAQDMVKASLAADSLALGVHWIYDPEEIRTIADPVDSLLAPGPGSYHPTKTKGMFTHYGDQTLVLLNSLARSTGDGLSEFFDRWQALFRDYDGYVDAATRGTLKRIEQGKGADCGSLSNDIAGAARAVPMAAWFRDDPDQAFRQVRAQTRMTHSDPDTVDAAEFFARVSLACLGGERPSEAMARIAASQFADQPVEMWVHQGLHAVDRDSLAAVLAFGQSCHTPEAFSGVVQIIAKYENNLSEAVIQAVMAGGDNAARASLAAQVLAAFSGMDKRCAAWFDQLVLADEISALIHAMP